MERRKITLPLTKELAQTLHAGDQVLLTGTTYTSRDAGHKRMCEALARGEKIPFDPTDATIYYVGPTPAKPGAVIDSAGPTTSGRMDAYAPTMMSVGARGMIGKGARLPEVVDAMKKYSGVYFGAVGACISGIFQCNGDFSLLQKSRNRGARICSIGRFQQNVLFCSLPDRCIVRSCSGYCNSGCCV